jgi:glyoxylase I family protein
MANSITTGSVHHVTLTVTDVARARDFYTSALGFQVALEYGPKILLTNGQMVLAIAPAPDPARATIGDRFDENRVGLDHLSFSVANRDELDDAVRIFDERGVSHGEIEDLGEALRLYTLAFRDPDNIQLELSAPYR